MNPPALSHPSDAKHTHRPPPRDPKAADVLKPTGTPKAAPGPANAADAATPSPAPEEAFQTLVDKAAMPATASAASTPPAKAETGDGKPKSESGEDQGMDGTPDGKTAAEVAKAAAPGAVPLILAQPHPPVPPAPAHKGAGLHTDGLEGSDKPGPHRSEHAALAPAKETLAKPAEPAEPKKNPAPAGHPAENFSALLTDAKAPAETAALPQAAAHAAPVRAAEPLPPSPPISPAPAPPLPVVALPASIAIKALEGTNRFDIRLDPEELGRIDVSLQIDKDGAIRASIAAEKPEALQLIVREARALEQAFDQAGFRRDDNALSFSLSDQGQFAQNRQHSPAQQSPNATRFFVEGEADLPPSLATVIASADGRLDVRI